MSCNSSFSLNLVPRALFPGFEGAKARERRPGDEVGSLSVTNLTCVAGPRALLHQEPITYRLLCKTRGFRAFATKATNQQREQSLFLSFLSSHLSHCESDLLYFGEINVPNTRTSWNLKLPNFSEDWKNTLIRFLVAPLDRSQSPSERKPYWAACG